MGEIKTAQFRITLETYEDIARQILKGWQFRIYKIKLRGLLFMIEKRLNKFKSEESDKEKKVFSIENDDKEILEKEKKELEAFLFGDYSELNKDNYNEFKQHLSNRFIQLLNRRARLFGDKVKEKALKISLGGDSVLSFFNRIGISIKWEILD